MSAGGTSRSPPFTVIHLRSRLRPVQDIAVPTPLGRCIEACSAGRANQYLPPAYVEHNANPEVGLRVFLELLSRFQPLLIGSSRTNPSIRAIHGATAKEWVNPLVDCAGNDPHDSSKKYKYNSF